jgi:hypothetical protein
MMILVVGFHGRVANVTSCVFMTSRAASWDEATTDRHLAELEVHEGRVVLLARDVRQGAVDERLAGEMVQAADDRQPPGARRQPPAVAFPDQLEEEEGQEESQEECYVRCLLHGTIWIVLCVLCSMLDKQWGTVAAGVFCVQHFS